MDPSVALYVKQFSASVSISAQIPAGQHNAGAWFTAYDAELLTPWSTAMPGVSPTSWMYFAASRVNRLRLAAADRPFKVYLPLGVQ